VTSARAFRWVILMMAAQAELSSQTCVRSETQERRKTYTVPTPKAKHNAIFLRSDICSRQSTMLG
jgi:hypothetical protein